MILWQAGLWCICASTDGSRHDGGATARGVSLGGVGGRAGNVGGKMARRNVGRIVDDMPVTGGPLHAFDSSGKLTRRRKEQYTALSCLVSCFFFFLRIVFRVVFLVARA